MQVWKSAAYVKFGDPRFYNDPKYPSQTWEKKYNDRKYSGVKRKYTEYGWNSKNEHEFISWDMCSAMLQRR